MTLKYISCDSGLCAGCQICELVCSSAKYSFYSSELTRIHTVRVSPTQVMSIPCRVCEDPPCVKACPRSALSIKPETGIIILDKGKCAGCGWCIEACDFGAIIPDINTKTILVCDLCPELEKPRCIEFCPKGALSFTTHQAEAQKSRIKAAKKLFSSE